MPLLVQLEKVNGDTLPSHRSLEMETKVTSFRKGMQSCFKIVHKIQFLGPTRLRQKKSKRTFRHWEAKAEKGSEVTWAASVREVCPINPRDYVNTVCCFKTSLRVKILQNISR